MIAAAAAVTAALAAGSGAALASASGGKSGTAARTMSATGKPGGPGERQAQNAMTAAVAQALHVSTARVSAALRPLFAAGHADPSSPAFTAAARSLGVSTHQLTAALIHAKESLAPGA
jgi:hypothetical protein